MDVYETRKANVRRLIDEQFGGVATRFAARLGRSSNQVCRWFMTNENKRTIGEKLARVIEQQCGLADGWLDLPHEGEEMPSITQGSSALLDHSNAAFRLEALKIAAGLTPNRSADAVLEDAEKFVAMIFKDANGH